MPQVISEEEKTIDRHRKMNPFTPPPDECLGRAFPSKEHVCQFSLKSMAVVIAAMLIGGNTAHRQALSYVYLIGGSEVEMSMRGEFIYFAVGCIGGAACAVGAMACWTRIRRQWAMHGVGTVWRELLLLPLATVSGFIGGFVMFVLFKVLLACLPSSTITLFVNAPQ